MPEIVSTARAGNRSDLLAGCARCSNARMSEMVLLAGLRRNNARELNPISLARQTARREGEMTA